MLHFSHLAFSAVHREIGQVKETFVLLIELLQCGVALYCWAGGGHGGEKRREGDILYIMMSLFVWEKICTIVTNVHLSWYFLSFFLLFNIELMLELLIINLMMCRKIVSSIAKWSHTQLLWVVHIVLQNILFKKRRKTHRSEWVIETTCMKFDWIVIFILRQTYFNMWLCLASRMRRANLLFNRCFLMEVCLNSLWKTFKICTSD